jgi:hypothetical protein
MDRLRAVAREYEVAPVALALLADQLQEDPSALRIYKLRQRDFDRLRLNLEATYLIRLFAEFETGLREAWKDAFRRPTHPKMVDLLEAIAARCTVCQPWQDGVHKVRRYRNALVHEEGSTVEVVGILEARGHLARFFSRLPSDW